MMLFCGSIFTIGVTGAVTSYEIQLTQHITPLFLYTAGHSQIVRVTIEIEVNGLPSEVGSQVNRSTLFLAHFVILFRIHVALGYQPFGTHCVHSLSNRAIG